MTELRSTVDSMRRQLVQDFVQHASTFGIAIIHPFEIRDQKDRKIPFPLMLPQFGGPKGAVVDVVEAMELPDAQHRIRELRSQGFWFSFLNLAPFNRVDLEEFCEILDDWNFQALDFRLAQGSSS